MIGRNGRIWGKDVRIKKEATWVKTLDQGLSILQSTQRFQAFIPQRRAPTTTSIEILDVEVLRLDRMPPTSHLNIVISLELREEEP